MDRELLLSRIWQEAEALGKGLSERIQALASEGNLVIWQGNCNCVELLDGQTGELLLTIERSR